MQEFSLADLWAPLKAHRVLIAIITVAVTVLAVLYAYFMVPTTWEAETSIVFEDSSNSGLNMLRQVAGMQGFGGSSASRGDFLEVLLKSRSVRGRVVDELNLVDRLDVGSRLAAIGRISKTYETQLPVAQVLVLRTAWEGEPLASVNMETTDAPEMAADLAGALISSLQKEVSHNDYTEAARRRKLIEEQLQTATQELNSAEDTLVEYATSEGLIDVSGQTGAAVSQLGTLQQREAELQSTLDGALAREAAARAKLNEQDQMAVSSMSEARDPALNTLRQRIIELEQQITEQKEVQGKSDQHPDVASLISELESARQQLADLSDGSMQVERRSMSVDPNYSRLMEEAVSNSQRVAEIRANIDAVRQQRREALSIIEQLPARSTEYLRLQREVEMKGQVVADLTENYEMARLSEAGSTASFSIIDEPIPPGRPSSPSLKKIGAVAFVAALLFSMLVAFWRNGTAGQPVTEEPPAEDQVA